jgi:23S rRNA (adenine2503-C2)-methyltransferase
MPKTNIDSMPPANATIYDLDSEGWKKFVSDCGEPAYRARQIWHNLYRQLAPSAEAMSGLPALLREKIVHRFPNAPLAMVRRLDSADGSTWKYLYRLADDARIEAVRMSYRKRETACLSTQAGCGMGCLFCATGNLGLTRSLSAGEIIAQGIGLARSMREEGATLSNIVLMGMGEPFANYEATLQAIRRWMDPDGFAFGARRITVSTVGIVPGIRRFAGERLQVNLAVSLHAANDSLRNQLVPANRAYPLRELMSACADYIGRTNRRISIEWALMEGRNDSNRDAEELAALLFSVPAPLFHVNLIPLNAIAEFTGQPSADERVRQFQQIIERRGIACTVRLRRGLDILAGCGQLAAHILKGN